MSDNPSTQDQLIEQLKRIADALEVGNGVNQAWIETNIRWKREADVRREKETEIEAAIPNVVDRWHKVAVENTAQIAREHSQDVLNLCREALFLGRDKETADL